MPLHHKLRAQHARPLLVGNGGRPAPHAPTAVPPPISTPAWLSVAQLCQRWQLGRKTIYKFIDSRLLAAWRVGAHLYRISLAEIQRFEAENALRPEEQPGRSARPR